MIDDLVYDVGMHNGDDTAYYLQRGYRVVAIEAAPDLVEAGRLRFAREIAENRLTICPVAIAETEGEISFWICESHSVWNSTQHRLASRKNSKHREIAVPSCRLRKLLDAHGVPFFMKIDIEGSDFLCLEDLDSADLPRYLSIEVSQVHGLAIPTRLRDLGYTSFKCISQFHYLPLQLPPSSEQINYERWHGQRYSRSFWLRVYRKLGAQRHLDRRLLSLKSAHGWVFPEGSSGSFGEETFGRWQTYDELCDTYRTFSDLAARHQPSIFWRESETAFWADLHARRDG